jgi:hypothetical protein
VARERLAQAVIPRSKIQHIIAEGERATEAILAQTREKLGLHAHASRPRPIQD